MAMGQNPVAPVNIPIPTKPGSKLGARSGAKSELCSSHLLDVAVGQIQWYHFGGGAPPMLEPILVVEF